MVAGRGSRSRASGPSRRSRRTRRRAAPWPRSGGGPGAIRKTAGCGGEGAPERAAAAGGLPASLVDIDDRCRLDPLLELRCAGRRVPRPARWMTLSTDPVESSTPNSSRASSVVSRRETRLRTASVTSAACRRGPNEARGTPAGSSARVDNLPGLGGVRPQYRLRAAGIFRRHRQHGRAGRPRSRQAALATIGRRPRLRPPYHRRDRHAGRRSSRRLAQHFQDRQRRRDPHLCRADALDRRQYRNVADRARAQRSAEPALFQRRALPARVPHPAAQLRAGLGRRRAGGRRAHLRGHAGAGDRCGRRAQTHHHAGRPRARFACGACRQCASGAADAAARRRR